MKRPLKKISCFALICLIAVAFLLFLRTSTPEVHAEGGELKGVWVASVFGIDYPQSATADDNKLRNEAKIILDNVADMGFNAVFLQIRPCSDALYKSNIYPWSQYLTGTQGLAPDNGFDPLAYFVSEAHKRGIALHAWINPYRVTAAPDDNKRLSPESPAVKNPELTILHTDGKLYFNPGEPAARQLILDGVAEILQNYDVDGIHLDDYFYPDNEFADEQTFQKYRGGFDNIGDWRRNNNTMLIRDLHAKVKELKPAAVFGVSPFGIWANKASTPLGSDTRGSESYSKMFADTRLWVKEGYLDYIMPQIYWSIGYEIADYQKLLSWWKDVTAGTDVTLYIGQAAYRAVDAKPGSEWANGAEIRRQTALNKQSGGVSGYCMFSYNSFLKEPSLSALIKELNAETPAPETPAAISGFPDIADLPQRESIEYASGLGIIKGYEDGKFHPYDNIRRGDFVLMLMRMFALPIETGLPNFDDVKPGTYYYDEIATAKAKSLIFGVDGIDFSPSSNITNQDLYVMAYRAIAQLESINQVDESILETYTDASQIADYARQAIAYFTESGVFTQTAVNPGIIADRANAADFIAHVVRMK